jgi:hypothetical protein
MMVSIMLLLMLQRADLSLRVEAKGRKGKLGCNAGREHLIGFSPLDVESDTILRISVDTFREWLSPAP